MNWLARLIDVRDGERRLVLKVAFLFAVVQSTVAFGANGADALFFLRFGVENLPLMILLSGVGVMIALLAHSAGLGRRGARSWLPTVTFITGMLAIGQWALAFSDTSVVYAVIWVGTQILIMVTIIALWNAAAASASTRQAKRLYPIWASAGVLGAVLGNLATGLIATSFGTPSLLFVQGSLLLVGSGVMRNTSVLFRKENPSEDTSVLRELTGAGRTVLSSRLLRLAAAVSVALSALFYMVVFPFNEEVAAAFDSEEEIAGFLGLFASGATAMTFLVSLFVANRLFSRFGIIVSLLILPLVYVAGFGIWLGSFNLPTAAAVRGAQWVAVNAIGLTALTATFNVLPGRRRAQVMSFVTAVPFQIGTVIGGAVLLGAALLPQRATFAIGLVVAIGASAVVLAMRPAYADAVVETVRKGLVGVFGSAQEGLSTVVGKECLDALASHLDSDDPGERLIGLAGLREARSEAAIDVIEPLFADPDPRVRVAALDTVIEHQPDKADTLIRAALLDSSPLMRRRGLEAHRFENDTDASILASLLDDPDPWVKAKAAQMIGGDEGENAVSLLLASDDPSSVLAVLETRVEWVDPLPYLRHQDPEVRVAALGMASLSSPTDPGFRACLDDVSYRVRRVAAQSLASSEEGRFVLLDSLATGSVRATEVALRALVPLDRFTDDFLDWAAKEAGRARMLSDHAAVVEAGPDHEINEMLARTLRSRSEVLSHWVIVGMTTVETAETMGIVERGVFTDDPEIRAQAIEALDVLGQREVTGPLIDLLEAGSLEVQSFEESLEELAGDFDPWISRLASRIIADSTESATGRPVPDSASVVDKETRRSLTDIDRVIALGRVPVFAGLDPEDLGVIAGLAEEATVNPSERIYRMGDPGTEMMVIVDGEAIVTVDHAGELRQVASYGPGEHIGELAIIQGSTRTADVHAGDEGLYGLVISGSDLMSVFDERPAVAIAMLKTLANRLTEQT